MDRFELAGAAFAQLCRTMARLRAECPWDREQTLASLKRYLLEETHEVLEAIEDGSPAAHRDELGDLLLQIVFQAEITHGQGDHGAADVADAINAKLIRRHPHVYGSAGAPDHSDVNAKVEASSPRGWEESKAKERAGKGSRLDGVPKSMPALMRALRVGEKAATIGFDWPDIHGVRAKVNEEWDELHEALVASKISSVDYEAVAEELGDLLLSLTSYCRHLDINPEEALNRAVDKFIARFVQVEAAIDAAGHQPTDLTLQQLEALWQKAKMP